MDLDNTNKLWARKIIDNIDIYNLRGDSINIWGLPLIGTSTDLKDLEDYKGNVTFVYFDTQMVPIQSASGFFNLLTLHLSLLDSEISEKHEDQTILATYNILQEILKKKRICLIVDNMENLIGLDDKFLATLKSLRNRFRGAFNFIFVSNKPLAEHPYYVNKTEFLDFAIHQQFATEPFKDSEITEAIGLNTHKKFTEKELEKLNSWSGGIKGILNSVIRHIEFSEIKDVTENELINDGAIRIRLERIYESFSPEELDYLRKIATGKKTGEAETKYLRESGILSNQKIRSKLIETYIEKRTKAEIKQISDEDRQKQIDTQNLYIDQDSGEIHIRGTRQESLLSGLELQLTNYLIKSEGKLVTRDKLADILWNEDSDESYSSWAIDKAISRIRKKIRDTKRPYQHLVTVKGKGFKFYYS